MVRADLLGGTLPVLTFGHGPDLVVLPGLEAASGNPAGLARRMEEARYAAYARSRSVHVVRRRVGIAPGTTMADLAGSLAAAITADLDAPVDVMGVSTGGSLALQLAVDQPQVVRRLVLVSAAARLSDDARATQRRWAERVRAGRRRQAAAGQAELMGGSAWAVAFWRAALWLGAPLVVPDDPADLLRTVEAEDSYDVTARLGEVTAPTLLVAGARDHNYGADLLRRTAAGIPDARLRLHPRYGHAAATSSRRVPAMVLDFLEE